MAGRAAPLQVVEDEAAPESGLNCVLEGLDPHTKT